MPLSRRFVLRTGVASLVVIAGSAGWLSTRTSMTAREPWRAANAGFNDPRLNALAYAILAPNPHNMQPWQVKLEGDDAFSLFASPERLLPETDPPCRQITIGFGCFLELFRQAAAEQGFVTQVDAFPEGEPYPVLDGRPLARVRIKQAQVDRDPLFSYALSRHTQRAPFDTARSVDAAILAGICSVSSSDVRVECNAEPPKRARIRELSSKAWIAEWENAATREETIKVTRIGKAEVAAQPWGITLDGPLMSILGLTGVLSKDGMRSSGTTAYRETQSSYSAACDSAMAHIWSSTSSNTRLDQLRAGATWVRLHQAATREGLAFHPLSQALQEFPAMSEYYRQAHAELAPAGHTLQMLVRLGYTAMSNPAPREPLMSKLISA